MSENKLLKNRIWMVGLIIIIASVSASLLTAINLGTRERIALNEEIKLKKSVLSVFEIPYEKDEIIAVFDQNIKTREVDGVWVYEYVANHKTSAIAFQMKGSGFWGPITGLVALDPRLTKVKGVEILRQEETPGLGGRISEDVFKDQFKGRAVEPEIQVDAITGATMTSKAFKTMINDETRKFKVIWQKQKRRKR